MREVQVTRGTWIYIKNSLWPNSIKSSVLKFTSPAWNLYYSFSREILTFGKLSSRKSFSIIVALNVQEGRIRLEVDKFYLEKKCHRYVYTDASVCMPKVAQGNAILKSRIAFLIQNLISDMFVLFSQGPYKIASIAASPC